ncbi:MAG: RecX family transcriptional regulator [Sphingomonas sp.]|nr:RecX family transcriptional regulator [Sphingomonas sp.]
MDAAALEQLALHYVARYATSRARLIRYLNDKVRARDWQGPPADPQAIADRFVALGYIDDIAFGRARANAMRQRGLGTRRIAGALIAAGIDRDGLADIARADDAAARQAALVFARRRRLGPYAPERVGPDDRRRHIVALVRAGHDYDLAREIVDLPRENCHKNLT